MNKKVREKIVEAYVDQDREVDRERTINVKAYGSIDDAFYRGVKEGVRRMRNAAIMAVRG